MIAPPRSHLLDTAEGRRLAEARSAGWRRWGPYPSDRQWGTVREDYSADGDAWRYFPHAQARSRAYRWGEDALAGWGDEHLHWCLGLALWNGQDEILKERLFGLTNAEGNHGEDVKELYFYTDATPTHSWMRMLYRYPHAAFPYAALIAENARRDQSVAEYEIQDTGVFAGGLFCDVTVDYARAGPDDTLMRITAHNRAGVPTRLHLLPQFWARNIWSWSPGTAKPGLTLAGTDVLARHPAMAPLLLSCDPPAPWLFCENETNEHRVFGTAAAAGVFKDGIGDFVVAGTESAIRRDSGTRCAAHHVLDLPAGGAASIRVRLRPPCGDGFADFDAVMQAREAEADEFYAALQQDMPDADARLVQRQALAGMIWSKQFYHFDVRRWLDGDPTQPAPPAERRQGRDSEWQHVNHADIVAMPDKWEYPWYASWDLAFHAVTFALIDPEFAKTQMLLLLRDRAMHPNGQVPAYEWKFDDANPPVQAWGAWRVYQMDRALTGRADRVFLSRMFLKLLLNFGWWVNRKDASGKNLFQGGFLGLDNIEIFDRSQPLPTGGSLQQADGTAWMAAYALHMMRIALELAEADPSYQDIAAKFFEHFLYIAQAMREVGGGTGLWDDQDCFFYDLLTLPDGSAVPLRVRSIVGLIPLLAVHVLDPDLARTLPDFAARMQWFLEHRPDLAGLISHWQQPGAQDRSLLSLLRTHRMGSLLRRMLDPEEFLSPHGVRALSKVHEAHPYEWLQDGRSFRVAYVPGESDSRMFGGNSNWRGPVWLPINFLLIEALREFDRFYGAGYTIACPTGTDRHCTLGEVADEMARRVTRLLLKGADGERPAMAGCALGDADLLMFNEYFHGETGRGLGASHQTGWTGLLALLLAK